MATHSSGLLDIDQAAHFLNVKVSRLRSAILKKEIPFLKIGRLVHFHKEDLEARIEGLKKKMKPQYLSQIKGKEE